MQAAAGDRVVIRGHQVGGVQRTGLILEVRGENGAPPYIVRWDDDPEQHDHLFFPGSDADIEPAGGGDD